MEPCYHTPVNHRMQGGQIINENYPYAVFLFGDDPDKPVGEGRMCAICNKLYTINLGVQMLMDSAVARSKVVKTGVGDIQGVC
jgi:hypothetical protein